MLHYYSGSNQIPGTMEPYKFEAPKYGASTTDPTFYEPTATRIANMRKAAGAKLKGIYDFDGALDLKGKTKEEALRLAVERADKEMQNGVVDLRFSKHGLTREEVAQKTMEKSLQVEDMISEKKKNIKDNTDKIKQEVAIAEAISQNMVSKEAENGTTTE